MLQRNSNFRKPRKVVEGEAEKMIPLEQGETHEEVPTCPLPRCTNEGATRIDDVWTGNNISGGPDGLAACEGTRK